MNRMFGKKVWSWFWLATAYVTGCSSGESLYSSQLRSDVFKQTYTDSKYDFLWVLDNSGSMQPNRQYVSDNIQIFLNIVNSRKAVDFQMAVTTTDMFTDQGNLIASPEGKTVIKSATATDSVGDFAAIVGNVQDSATSFWEQGLESAYQATLNSGSQFSRPGVPLIIITVSDENDYSCGAHCWGLEPEKNPDVVLFNAERYSKYFTGLKQAQNSETVFFPIVGVPTSTACTVASYGLRYMDVAASIGGLSASGSICNTELKASYEAIAQVLADRGTVFKLSMPTDGSGLQVYVDQKLIPYSPDSYGFDSKSNAIVFNNVVPINGSVIEVTYLQK